MKVTFRYLRRVLTASAAFALVGFSSLQFAAADGPDGPAVGPGPAVVAAVDAPAPDAPPPGPALQHHFVHVARFPGFNQEIEHRMELMLFVDGSFNLIHPAMPDFGDGFCDKDAGPTTMIGNWGVKGNHLILQFSDGFEDFGLVTIGAAGPVLRFDGCRWTDLLAVPAPGPAAAPAPVGDGPIGPAVDAPVGPAVAGPAPVAP